jgi:hypothetical protein
MAMLAVQSASDPLADPDRVLVERAAAYLVAEAGQGGETGDAEFSMESHALATTALLCALPDIRPPELRRQAAHTIRRALQHTRRLQDRSRSSRSRGGWKMAGREGRENDRRASAWALLSLYAATRYGIEVETSHFDRAVFFLLGSLKETADNPDQVGGLSVDTEGLAVASISAMGGWALARVRPDAVKLSANLAWLERHPPVWSGPNYFYANFFRIRALQYADPDGAEFNRTLRLLYLQIRDHQLPDGAVGFPPGNAQNTIAMGPVFSTSMAILILNAPNSRLVFDEDYRVRPMF